MSSVLLLATRNLPASAFVTDSAFRNTEDRAEELDAISGMLYQTNVTGNIHLFNLFMPLIMKGKVKKVITLTSGHGDLDFINSLGVDISPTYAASKAAMNVIVGKFNVQYKKDGVLFMSISPGVVDVNHFADCTYHSREPPTPSHFDKTCRPILLTLIHSCSTSNSRTDSEYDGVRGQIRNLRTLLQGRDACR